MKIVEPKATLIPHDIHPYQFIEKVGRTCYKSEDKITPESAVKFIKKLADSKHWAMLEHEYIYFKFENEHAIRSFLGEIISDAEITMNDGEYNYHPAGDPEYEENRFNYEYCCTDDVSVLKYINISDRFMSGSFRAWYELFKTLGETNSEMSYSAYMLYQICQVYPELFVFDELYGERKDFYDEGTLPPEKLDYLPVKMISREELYDSIYNPKSDYGSVEARNEIASTLLPHTVLFICDRGVSHEFVRHRPASFGQESTRYCCYAKEKFGSEITVIRPMFYPEGDVKFDIWENACLTAENAYNQLIEAGSIAQEARSVLPNSLKTEIFITATEKEWQHIINLRYHGKTGAPHPQMKEVMALAYPQLVQTTNGRVS